MAGTVTFSSDEVFPKGRLHGTSDYPCVRELTVVCTADAAAATYPDTDLCDLEDLVHGPLSGWGLWMVETDPGATGPTDNTDLVLNTANGTDILGGNGANAIDNATNNLIYPPVSHHLIGGTLTQSISGNSVNSAVVTIKYYLAR